MTERFCNTDITRSSLQAEMAGREHQQVDLGESPDGKSDRALSPRPLLESADLGQSSQELLHSEITQETLPLG